MKKLLSIFLTLSMLLSTLPVNAATPSGNNWFQLLASPFTGGDNTGDGGTGNPADLNYYYVGQQYTTTIQIRSQNTNASNIWIDYITSKLSASNLTTGTYFPSWSGQSISGGRVMSTGYRTSGYSTGVGTFGTVRWTMIEPTAANYGTGAPTTLDINIGVIGATTESNISYNGSDILEDAEDFQLHIWADTKKPYALNPGPVNGAINVAVEDNYTFDLRDSKNGEGDNSGVGTGVNTATPPGVITFNTISYTAWDSYACSGIWGTNLCNVTVNPPSPLGIAGDQRNWEYSTLYSVNISGFQDLASPAQNQLGDTNGPNTMDPKNWTFTTEADTVAPRVVAETPTRGSINNSISTNITIDVHDKKFYPGNISGTGVNAATCKFNVSSPSFALTSYQQGHPDITVTPIDYGFRFVINPATDFAQNEVVTVSAYDCEDLASNTMVTDTWTFTTADTDPPYVDQRNPADDQGIAETGSVIFHIKDDGVGVDLASLVVYVNGIYYTSAGGGPGNVTTNGTRITFASTTAFTDLTGTVNDYTVTITPVNPFLPGESVPVLIYAKDFSNNIMERDVYAMAVGGGTGQICGNNIIEGNEVCDDGNNVDGDGCSANCLSNETCGNRILDPGEQCDDGNTVNGDGCNSTCQFEGVAGPSACGSNTIWNGSVCVANCPPSGGTGGGGSGGGSSGGGVTGGFVTNAAITNIQIHQINEASILVSWLTNMPATSRVVYDANEHPSIGSAPNYGYINSTREFTDLKSYHSVVVDNLENGTLYYFRPVVKANGLEIYGNEVRMAPLFATQYLEKVVTVVQEVPGICPPPTTRVVTPPRPVEIGEGVVPTIEQRTVTQLKIDNIEKRAEFVVIEGVSPPNSKLKLYIY
jgi:cysteine-rich repeat protein